MNTSASGDLQERISRLLDGEMQRAEAEALDAELRACPRARSVYLELAALHSALECQYSSRSENRHGRIIPIDLFLSRQRRRTVRISLLTAAAALALAAIPLWMRMAKNGGILASFQTTADASFVLSHPENFGDASGQILHTGSRLKLESGRLEAQFASGARCVLEAPCDLLSLGDDHVRISRGNAWFHIPPRAHGFKVDTGTLQIIDLGTEFGVLAAGDGRDEVHVTRGSVEASPLISGKPGKPVILTQGHAMKIGEAGELIKTALRASLFPNHLTQPLAIRNADFDAPPVDGAVYDSRGYGPIYGWGTSGDGVGFSDISQPFLNKQPAHSGTHAAFIQGRGLISQSVSGFDPSKKYTVTYFVSERGLTGASSMTAVSLDLGSTIHREPEPIRRTDAFRRIVSDPLHVFGPTANIEIRGQRVSGDASLLIDSVSISRAVPRVPEGGFENPVLPAASFNQDDGHIGDSPWRFSGGAGIIANRSAFGAPLSPEGSQAAVLQGNGAAIETTLQGFEPGSRYRLLFSAAGRKDGATSLGVSLGEISLTFDDSDSVDPTSNGYSPFASDEFLATSESLALRIQSAGPGSTFLDDVHLEFIGEDGMKQDSRRSGK